MSDTPMIYLASRSPRRGELLGQIGVTFAVLPSDVDESVRPDESPEHYVLRLAREKALVCAQRLAAEGLAGRPILAADTTVCIDGMVCARYGANAAAMLRRVRSLRYIRRSRWRRSRVERRCRAHRWKWRD